MSSTSNATHALVWREITSGSHPHDSLFGFGGGGDHTVTMSDDAALLRRYACDHAEEAFAELVRRHLDGVYSAALRRIGGDTHLAEDIAQKVFASVAREAEHLSRHPQLSAWLYATTRNVAANMVRSERRRKAREQEAQAMQETLSENAPEANADWSRVAPVLDEVIDELNEADRTVVLLRFVERRALLEIGAALKLSEDAARMRIERALEKLRVSLRRRGVTSSIAALSLMLTNQAVAAAPAGMAASVTGSALALATGGTAVAPVLAFFEIMSTSKFAAVGAALILALTVGTTVHEVRASREAGAALAAAKNERDTLAARLSAMQQRAGVAAQAVAALRQSLDQARARRSAEVRSTARPTREEQLAHGRDFMARHPEVRSAVIETRRAEIAGQHAPLFKLQRLSPAQIEQFKDLVVQGSSQIITEADGALMRYQIEGDREAAMEQLRVLLGEEGFRRYENPGALNSAWRTATELAGALYFTAAPLSMEQGERMVQILTAGSVADQGPARRWLDWSAILPQAGRVLSPAQLALLGRFQSQDEIGRASDEIRRQLRASPVSNPAAPTPKK